MQTIRIITLNSSFINYVGNRQILPVSAKLDNKFEKLGDWSLGIQSQDGFKV